MKVTEAGLCDVEVGSVTARINKTPTIQYMIRSSSP